MTDDYCKEMNRDEYLKHLETRIRTEAFPGSYPLTE
jgi:hypothetical protein